MNKLSPVLKNMKLPSILMKDFVVLPIISQVDALHNNYKFEWYRKISSKERDAMLEQEKGQVTNLKGNLWFKLSDSITYNPLDDDLAHHLRVVCRLLDGTQEVSLVSNSPVEMGPADCPFQKRQLNTPSRILDNNKFRIIAHNLLADIYAKTDYSKTVLFAHCPPYSLDIEYRRQLIIKELLGYNGDIYCLQEVDKKQYQRFYEPLFRLEGNFSGIFNAKGHKLSEGLATFFCSNKFDLLDSHVTLLSDLIESRDENRSEKRPHVILDNPLHANECLKNFDIIRAAILSKEQLKERFLNRHNILQTTLLKVKSSNCDYIIVANTHLYFAPDADHVRLLQGSVCIKYLEYIKDYYLKKFQLTSNSSNTKLNIGLVFCGDLNSTPDCGIYKLITEGKASRELIDWSSNELESVTGLEVETNLKMASAYKDIAYTNYTPDFNGCLDYIYYEKDTFTCESVVPPPDHEDVIAVGGIPNNVFPSDHIALIAELRFSQL